MPFAPAHSDTPRLPWWAIAALALLYLLSWVGREPWRNEDAIHLGIAYAMATDGLWLFPHIAGEAWPHTPPLYHWVAALLGQLFAPLLPFHAGARLASALFGALFLFAISRAADALHGPSAARAAPLLAIGTLGLLLPIHEAQPAIAGLAFAALAWWGGALFLGKTPTLRWQGAALIGAGTGLAFFSHGIVGLLMAIAVLPAPTFRRDWLAFATALFIAIAISLIWPLALLTTTPELWQAWWQNELAELLHSRSAPAAVHAELVAWGYWPILPLALWTLWVWRDHFRLFLLPIIGSVLGLAWFLSGGTRLASLLPAMTPLLLIASAGAERLRRGAANAWSWFALLCFSFFGALVWLGASAQTLDWPSQIAGNFERIAPGHGVEYSLGTLAWAAGLSLLWLGAWLLPRAPWRPAFLWATGLTLLWALTATLWLTWLDHARSYRGVLTELQAAAPREYRCIERKGMNAAHRAVLDYHAGLHTRLPGTSPPCDWRITVGQADFAPAVGWTLVWSGHRPGDRRERWYLERRGD